MTNPGTTTLATIRTAVRQRTDMVVSQFVTDAETNGYINSSYQELYDLLVQKYGNDYYVATRYTFTTDGTNDHYTLPDGSGAPPAFYKLLGVDLQLASGQPNTNVSLKPFTFSERNRYTYPSRVWLGVTNLRYRLAGSIGGNTPTQQLWLTPLPAAGQIIGVWYVPRLSSLANDTDIVDGVSGWEEFIVVDAAIKCLQKEESDVSVLLAQKRELIKRIESAAENRDAGSPAVVSDSRRSDHLGDISDGWGYP